MNPALANYMMQVQQQKQAQAQQPEGENAHPFQSGISMAMQAARQSMGIPSPENQHQNSVSNAFMAIGDEMMRPHENRLSGFINPISAGIKAYGQSQQEQGAQEQQMNAMLYAEAIRQKEKEMAHQQRAEEGSLDRELRREQLAQQMTMHQDELGETRRAHDLAHQDRADMIGIRQKNLEDRYGISGLIDNMNPSENKKEVSLNSLNKTFVNEWSKDVRKEISQIPAHEKVIGTIDKMGEIFKKYPNVGASFLNLLEDGGKSEGGALNYLSRMFVDKNELTAIQQLKKLSSDLNLSMIKAFPGKAVTDIMKRTIRDAAPSGKLTYDAFKAISEDWKNESQHNIERARQNQDAITRGVYPVIETYEKNEISPQMQENSIDLGSLSDEELERIANQ